MTCPWEDGIFLGVKGSSGECIVGDGNGVWKTRTLMRRPLEEKWDKGALGLVGGVPWRVNHDDPKADGEAMKMDIPLVQLVNCSTVHLFSCRSVFFSCSVVVQVFKCSSVQVIKCSSVQVFKCSTVQMLSCSAVQLFSCSAVQLFKCFFMFFFIFSCVLHVCHDYQFFFDLFDFLIFWTL